MIECVISLCILTSIISLFNSYRQQAFFIEKIQRIQGHEQQIFCFQQSLNYILDGYHLESLNDDELIFVDREKVQKKSYIRYKGASIYMAKARGGHFVLLTALRKVRFSKTLNDILHLMVIFKDGFKTEFDLYI